MTPLEAMIAMRQFEAKCRRAKAPIAAPAVLYEKINEVIHVLGDWAIECETEEKKDGWKSSKKIETT